MAAECGGCGGSFTPKPRKNASPFCSEACRVWRYNHPSGEPRPAHRECQYCSGDISHRAGNAKFCSRRCGELALLKRTRKFPRRAECKRCGREYSQERPPHLFCSRKCFNAQYRQDHPEKFKWNASKKAAYHRRRARKRKAQSVERVVAEEVFERDGWSCGICGEAVEPNCEWPDPLSPSLDHIVPLSKGGAHSLENVQLAHLGCNVSKGDRLAIVA